MNVAIILAAGNSKRMKGIDKVFFKIKKKPLALYILSVFEKNPNIQKIILVTKKDSFQKFTYLIKKWRLKKALRMVEGGKERQDSAFLGLKAAEAIGAKTGSLILFHNIVNPLVSQEEINKVLKAAKKYGAALVGQSAKDTIKEVDKNGLLVRTIDRKRIFLAQTPQAIEFSLSKKAFEKAEKDNFLGTDDVSLVERLGRKVKIIPCSYKNIKVTTREDLKIINLYCNENYLC